MIHLVWHDSENEGNEDDIQDITTLGGPTSTAYLLEFPLFLSVLPFATDGFGLTCGLLVCFGPLRFTHTCDSRSDMN